MSVAPLSPHICGAWGCSGIVLEWILQSEAERIRNRNDERLKWGNGRERKDKIKEALSLIRTYHLINVTFYFDTSLHGVRMASALRRPTELSFYENWVENWRTFELDVDIYNEAACPGANAKTKVYMLLNLTGSEAIERSRTFEYAEGEK